MKSIHYYGCMLTLLLFVFYVDLSFAQMVVNTGRSDLSISTDTLESMLNRPGMRVEERTFTLEKGETIDGHLAVVGGNAFISGRIEGELLVIDGSASLQRESEISGDVTVVNGHIYASQHASVKGRRLETSDRYVVTRHSGGWVLRPEVPEPVKLNVAGSWRFNRVRGHDFGLTLGVVSDKQERYPDITGTLWVPTVTNNHGYLDYQASIKLPLIGKKALSFKLDGYKITRTNDNWNIPIGQNSLFAFLTANDLYNYHLRRGFTASVRRQLHEKITIGVSYQHDAYRNLGTHNPFALFGHNRGFRVNPDIDEGDIHSIAGNVRLDTRQISDNGWYMEAEVERAAEALGSDFQFTRYDIMLQRYSEWHGHQLNFRLKFAGSSAPLPLQRSYVLGTYSGLRGFGKFEYAGDRLLVINAEYQLPLKTLRKDSYVSWDIRLVTFFDTGTAFFSAASGRNVLGLPTLRTRVNPIVPLKVPESYSDLRSNAGVGLSISSNIVYATVQVAQNLHDFGTKPRILVLLYRDIF